MSIFSKFFFTLFGGGLVRPIWERVSNLYLNFLDDNYIVSGTPSTLSSYVTHSRSGNATMTDGYGPELVTNGSTDWFLAQGWSVSSDGKTLTQDGTGSGTAESIKFQPAGNNLEDKMYVVSFSVDTSSSTDVLDGPGIIQGNLQKGQYTINFLGTNSANALRFRPDGTALVISDVSVREMPVIKWAPHNLLTYSEEFDNPAWAKSGCTITANATTAPDGTVSADKVTYTSGSTYIRRTSLPPYVVSSGIWLRADSPTTVDFRLVPVGSGSPQVVSCSVTTEWVLFSNGLNITSSSLTSTQFWIDNFSADFYIWGAHLYRSDLGGMVDNPDRGDSYVPTTSSAVYLPRRNHYAYNGGQWVNEGLLTESESRQNLVEESEDFSGYTLTNLASIAVSATPVAPDGNQTALRLLDNSSTSLKALSKSTYTASVVSGDRVTISAYFQKGTLSYGVIYAVTGSGTPFGASPGTLQINRAACFDLDNGNVGIVGSLLSDGRVENVGNGWYRCSVTVIAGGTGTFYPAFGLTDADDGDTTYTSAGTGTVYLWGAQMEVGATPSSYMPTSGATFTRAADTLTIPAANLPWPTPNVIGSELVTNGTFDTDTDWTKGGGATIAGGVANFPAENDEIYQQPGFDENSVYLLTFTATGSGSLFFRLGSISTNVDYISSSGTYEFYVRPTSSAGYLLFRSFGFVGNIDNVSVKEIDPLSVSIQMDGRMTYADEGGYSTVVGVRWQKDSDNYLTPMDLSTNSTDIGRVFFSQEANNIYDPVSEPSPGSYSPGILVPYNIASRHGSTFINGAVQGTALTANTTPTALPDLSSTDLQLAYDYMGTIRTFRIWDGDLTDEGIAYVSERSEEPTVSLSFNKSESSFTVSDWLP